jgi:hypothetical protein
MSAQPKSKRQPLQVRNHCFVGCETNQDLAETAMGSSAKSKRSMRLSKSEIVPQV